MAVGKESIKRAASSTTKKPATRKSTAAKTKAAEVAAEAAVEANVAEAAAAAEENAAKFMPAEPVSENKNQPVRLTDKMPVHLL